MNTKTDTRQSLINAATMLFVQKNYESVSIREICKKASTTINMVNYYFGSKKGLYDEILSGLSEEVFMVPLKLLDKRPRSKAELRQLLEVFFDQTLDALIANRYQYLLASRERVKSETMATYQQGFIDFIDRAKKDGLVREKVDPGMLTGLIVGRLTSQVVDAEWINKVTGTDITSDDEYRKRWMTANIDIFLYGIMSEK